MHQIIKRAFSYIQKNSNKVHNEFKKLSEQFE